MTALSAVVAVSLALAVQAALAQLWPDAGHYLDLPMVPVVWYGVARSQRSAMLVGCAAGLLQDAWFELGAFGLSGFKKTLLGWILGGIASRFDLNQPGGRLAAGAAVTLADRLLELPLRRLLDQQPGLPGPLELIGPAVMTGLLVMLAGNIVERMGGRRAVRHSV